MTTWHEIARDSRKAANEMVETRFRSCLSRSYYAVYSKVTHDLAAAPGATFPLGREGPNHPGASGSGGIRRLIETSMPGMSQERRVKLSELVGELYTLRLYADYRPSIDIDAPDAREAISIMNTVFDAF
ncbi:MAG: hypothetical protein ACFCVE_07255 [Phycisphaerae bacterium]